MVNKNSNILFIGYEGYNSWARKVFREIEKQGYYCEFLNPREIFGIIITRDRSDYSAFKRPISLRDILRLYPEGMDYVFYSQNWLRMVNDTHVPVIYWHHEMELPPAVENPTYLFTNCYNSLPILRDNYPWWYTQIKLKRCIGFSVEMEEFNPNRKKEFLGINYMSIFEATMFEKRNIIWNMFTDTFKTRWDDFLSNGYIRVLGGETVKYEQYKDFLEKSEALLHFGSLGTWLSRRVMEAGAAKTIPVIHIPNKEAKEYLESIGFIDKKTCIFFKDSNDLRYISDQLSNPSIYDKDKITENLYNLILKKFTYEVRVKEIMSLIP